VEQRTFGLSQIRRAIDYLQLSTDSAPIHHDNYDHLRSEMDEIEMGIDDPVVAEIDDLVDAEDFEVAPDPVIDAECSERTIERYSSIWNDVRDFCILIGDFESAIIVTRTCCPGNPLPILLETLCACLRFFVFDKGEPLLYFKLPVKSFFTGQPLHCAGLWCSVVSINLFQSAIRKVHEYYDNTTHKIAYEQVCSGCLAEEARSNLNGCRKHRGNSRIVRKGCATTAKKFKSHHKNMLNYGKLHFKTRRTYGFTPKQVRLCREYLIASNSKFKLMIWTMMVVSIKQFMRVEDAMLLKVSDLVESGFSVTEHTVVALCMAMKGKRQQDTKNFTMWDDEDCPEFSPTRALLIWLVFSGITSGYLFPTKRELKDRCTSPTDHISYQEVLKEMKHICLNVLNMVNLPKVIIGTHIWRKTGYLFAIFGIPVYSTLESIKIQQSARHASPATAAVYLGCAETIKELIERVAPDDDSYRVGRWAPINIEFDERYAEINAVTNPFRKPLIELAEWFVFNLCKFPHRDPQHFNASEMHRSSKLFVSATARNKTLRTFLKDLLPASKFNEAMVIWGREKDALSLSQGPPHNSMNGSIWLSSDNASVFVGHGFQENAGSVLGYSGNGESLDRLVQDSPDWNPEDSSVVNSSVLQHSPRHVHLVANNSSHRSFIAGSSTQILPATLPPQVNAVSFPVQGATLPLAQHELPPVLHNGPGFPTSIPLNVVVHVPPATSSKKRKVAPEEQVVFSKHYQRLIPAAASAVTLADPCAGVKAQLALCKEAVTDVKGQYTMGKKVGKLTYAYKVAKVVSCFEHCHKSNMQEFCDAHKPKLVINEFKCNKNNPNHPKYYH
jgi:hypothetical protein